MLFLSLRARSYDARRFERSSFHQTERPFLLSVSQNLIKRIEGEIDTDRETFAFEARDRSPFECVIVRGIKRGDMIHFFFTGIRESPTPSLMDISQSWLTRRLTRPFARVQRSLTLTLKNAGNEGKQKPGFPKGKIEYEARRPRVYSICSR